MIIPLEKLVALEGNRYLFSCAAMKVVDKVGSVEGYPENDKNWKVVPNVLNLMLNKHIQYELIQYNKEK